MTRAPTIIAAGFLSCLPSILGGPGLSAQTHTHDASPYAEMADRTIKALSPEEVAGLQAGEGMGFALSAELNGLPGPKHVLELEGDLGLGAEQKALVEGIAAKMHGHAVLLGEELLALEGELDRRFAHGHITPVELARLTNEIGRVRGALRAAHLLAHLETRDVLRPEQIEAYARLRGYPPAR